MLRARVYILADLKIVVEGSYPIERAPESYLTYTMSLVKLVPTSNRTLGPRPVLDLLKGTGRPCDVVDGYARHKELCSAYSLLDNEIKRLSVCQCEGE